MAVAVLVATGVAMAVEKTGTNSGETLRGTAMRDILSGWACLLHFDQKNVTGAKVQVVPGIQEATSHISTEEIVTSCSEAPATIPCKAHREPTSSTVLRVLTK